MIEIKNLSKSFGGRVILRNLNLQIAAGDMVAIVGASGNGKSTLLNILGLIEDFDSGDYNFDGLHNIKPNSRLANKQIRAKISYIFQNFALIDEQTVAQNLALAQKYIKKSKADKLKQIDTALEKVGLADCKENKIFELSGGQQQRVAVARSMIKPSKIILADEPTGSLDEKNRDIILRELAQINATGKTIVIVTHDPKVAASCSRVIEL